MSYRFNENELEALSVLKDSAQFNTFLDALSRRKELLVDTLIIASGKSTEELLELKGTAKAYSLLLSEIEIAQDMLKKYRDAEAAKGGNR